MSEKFSTISNELIHSNPYWDYVLEGYVYPNGKVGNYYFVNSRGSTFIIPLLDNKIIMVEQFRYLNKKSSLEFPGGGITPGISILENAHKELEEETGFKSDNMDFIGNFNPCNGMTNEICHVFVSSNLYIGNINPDESEEIKIHKFDSYELNNLIKNQAIWDGMTLAAWSLFINSKYYKELL